MQRSASKIASSKLWVTKLQSYAQAPKFEAILLASDALFAHQVHQMAHPLTALLGLLPARARPTR